MVKRFPPRQQLRRLQRFARRTARYHGHALGPWREASPFWRREAQCTKCDAVAFISSEVDPAKSSGDVQLIGDALTVACRGF